MLAKVDSTEDKAITDRYGIKGFPTLLFFYNGDYVEYKGSREVEDILAWFNKKIGPPSIEKSCADDVLSFKPKDCKDMLVSYIGDLNNNNYKDIYLEVAKNLHL